MAQGEENHRRAGMGRELAGGRLQGRWNAGEREVL